ncbi:MAG: hypothetical protein WDO13_15025 [Verrucomicrobiota bacterium]
MDPTYSPARPPTADTYWLTRYVLLRWMGFVYCVAFYVAAQQLVPLVGAHGLTPAAPIFSDYSAHFADPLSAFLALPSLFWLNCSDTMLRAIPWTGLVLSVIMLAGYTNAIVQAILWMFYLSIVSVGLDWYGYGWELQMSETGIPHHLPLPAAGPAAVPVAAAAVRDHPALSLAGRAHHARLGADQAARRR